MDDKVSIYYYHVIFIPTIIAMATVSICGLICSIRSKEGK